MIRFITMSQLTLSEGLGSQMSNFAALHAVSLKTGHRIIFLNEWTAGKGMLLTEAFDGLPLEILAHAKLYQNDRSAMTFEINDRVVVDTRVFNLDAEVNYDIRRQFNSYRYWFPIREAVSRLFRFKPEIADAAVAEIGKVDARGREIVALHVRRTDYLASTLHLNLSMDYYIEACAQFRSDRYVFLVFSDDIEWCKQAFPRHSNFVYSSPSSRYVDMCMMSLCHHNIIANSTFSFWGAYLNHNPHKRVVCPARFLKDDSFLNYFNYAWYPDNWLAIDDRLG